jgi:glycosyltransferase involved in cell wall biosynthesis
LPPLPKITIVTPVLNAVDTVGEALASVRGQDYPHVEHVVVDGGSTDGTLEILERAPGISLTSEPDQGLSDAVNKGVARASGELIGWLNADDFYEPGALAAVGRAYAEHPDARWITGRCRIVDGSGKEIRKAVTAYKNLLLRRYSLPLLLTQNFISCPATFVHRDAYAEAGPLDLGYRISGDYDVFLRIARRHDPLILERELAAFRMDEGSLSMSGFELQFREHHDAARRNGGGHALAVGANAVTSRLIVAVYRALRARRRRASAVRTAPT